MLTHAPNGAPLLGIAGWKDSGKTSLLVRLTAELTARGYAIATVKHAHHGVDVDRPGTDSFRHREAGAGQVLLTSGSRWALMRELRGAPEPGLAEALALLGPCDLVLIEGYRREAFPKIEIRGRGRDAGQPLPCPPECIVAVVSDAPDAQPVAADGPPRFSCEATGPIADFVERTCGLAAR